MNTCVDDDSSPSYSAPESDIAARWTPRDKSVTFVLVVEVKTEVEMEAEVDVVCYCCFWRWI